MKKIITMLLVFCIIALQASCGAADPSPVTEKGPIFETESIDQEEETMEPTKEAATESISEIVQIPESVIYDENGIKVTVKSFDDSDPHDAKVLILVENNTDNNIALSGNHFAINDITMWCDLYIKAAAGKKANGVLEISRDDMEFAGIETIATISTKDVRIVDTDSYDTLFSLNFGIETSIAEGYVQEVDESGTVVLDQDGILVAYKGVFENQYGEKELLFFVKNSTDKDVAVTVDDVSVNDFTIYGSFLARAYSNTACYEYMDFSSDDMEQNGIEDLENVSFAIRVYEQETYDNIFKSGTIEIDVE